MTAFLFFLLACDSKDDLPDPPDADVTDTAPADIDDTSGGSSPDDTEPGDTALVDTAPPVDTGATEYAGEDPTALLIINEFLAVGADDPDPGDTGPGDAGAAPPLVAGDWLELFNLTGEAIDLGGFRLAIESDDPHEYTFEDGTLLPAGGFLIVSVDVFPGLDLPDSGGDLALYTPDVRPINALRYGPQTSGVSAARVPDGSTIWTYTERPTPGITNVPPEPEPFTALSAGSDWRYTVGEDTPGNDWKQAGYDDADWSEGPAPLGYGDSHIVTSVDYGGDSNNKYITTWFRRGVTVERADDVVALALELLCDDGCAVYLNDEPVLRYNLPEGLVLLSTTRASGTVSGGDETAFRLTEIPPELLVEGENQLAVEVHQAGPDSSDLGFDLSLYGDRLPE